jgi:hypothetical protein
MELVDTVVRGDLSTRSASHAFDVAVGISIWTTGAGGEKIADRGLAGAHHSEQDDVGPGHVDAKPIWC